MGKGKFPLMKLFLVAIVIGVVYSYAMFQGGFVSWFLFYSVVVVCILSLSILLVPLRKIKVHRHLNQNRYSSNEDAVITIEINRLMFHPFCYIKVCDHLQESLQDHASQGSQALFFLSFKRSLSYSYPLVNIPRGEHHFTSVEIVVGDLFGFFERKRTYSVSTSVVVFPRYQDLDDWKVGSIGSQEKSMSFSQSMETELSLAGVRKYIPGDRLTTIDWKHTARQNELMTKQFSQSAGLDCTIVFNSFLDYKSKEIFEKQVELATSIVHYFHQRKGSIGFLSIGESLHWIPRTMDFSAIEDMYGALAKIEYEKSKFITPENMPEVRSEESWIVVTSSLTTEFVDWLMYYQGYLSNIVVCWMLNEERTPLEEENRIRLRSKQIRVYAFTEAHFQIEKGESNAAKV